MAISTYAELQTAIGNWLGRPGDAIIAPIVPDWIALCELRINRELRIRAMEERATATVNGPYIALPDGFLAMRNLQLNTDPVTALDLVSPELIDRVARSRSDVARKNGMDHERGDAFSARAVQAAALPDRRASSSLVTRAPRRVTALTGSLNVLGIIGCIFFGGGERKGQHHGYLNCAQNFRDYTAV